jgi:hypothetical protein
MNISPFITMRNEKMDNWWIGKNKPNSNPIKAKTKPIQIQLPKSQNERKYLLYKGI